MGGDNLWREVDQGGGFSGKNNVERVRLVLGSRGCNQPQPTSYERIKGCPAETSSPPRWAVMPDVLIPAFALLFPHLLNYTC